MAKRTKAEEDRILTLAAERLLKRPFFACFEDLMCSPEGFGLVTATPLQRAIFKLIEGKPLNGLVDLDVVQRSLGNPSMSVLDAMRKGTFGVPSELVLVAGIRSAKSMMAAGAAIWASQTIDVEGLKDGEIPRYSMLSLSLDNARVTFGHLLAALQQPKLKHLLVDEQQTKQWTKLLDEASAGVVGSVFLWHPSGRPIEVRAVAGKRAGGSAVSRWSAGLVLDEAPRMVGMDDGVINYNDAVNAVRGRLRPGAQLLSIGSPWAPFGPVYDIVQDKLGVPTADCIVIKATGPDMNPFWWTPERCEEIKRTHPNIYQTDVLAEFADLEESMFPQALLEQCLRKSDPVLPWEERHDYVAAIDPATRGNAWTLVVCDRKGRRKRVVYTAQWQGSKIEPLSPRLVLGEIKSILANYKISWSYTDQWSADAIRDIANELGLDLAIEEWTADNKVKAFMNLAAAMADGTVELPNVPILLKDLRLTKKQATSRGVAIKLVNTPDGRHCDFSPALARCLYRWIEDEKPATPQPGTLDFWKWQEEQWEKEDDARYLKMKSVEWWENDPWSEEKLWA